jgi:hypothetical protein
MTMPPDPGNAFILQHTEETSYLEVIGAKMRPFLC